jgi:hypothetical protein
MSTTVRISKGDKERLARLARRLKVQTLAEALRRALAKAEEGDEQFMGDLDALARTLRSARPVGGNVSERVDEELAKALEKG